MLDERDADADAANKNNWESDDGDGGAGSKVRDLNSVSGEVRPTVEFVPPPISAASNSAPGAIPPLENEKSNTSKAKRSKSSTKG